MPNYVEPFFGSGAVLLGRPSPPGVETVNDKDGFLSNFWRAIQADPDAVAKYADRPVSENDLHAIHSWLVSAGVERIEGDPDYYDAKIAGWWVWGLCSWIGTGWCSGKGPWHVVDGRLVREPGAGGINRQRPHLSNAGQGVNRKLPHLGDAGRGVNRKRPHLGNAGRGVNKDPLIDWMHALSDRLRRVRVCCGDWSRICGPSPTFKIGLTGVFLDPPYSAEAGRDSDLYRKDDFSVAHGVADWCRANQDNPMLRIALCGYEGEHDLPGWDCVAWKAHGGYANRNSDNDNATRERIWFSPHCLDARQGDLFG